MDAPFLHMVLPNLLVTSNFVFFYSIINTVFYDFLHMLKLTRLILNYKTLYVSFISRIHFFISQGGFRNDVPCYVPIYAYLISYY